MNRLRGKVAAVTGAALGLGPATVVRMAEEGATVAVLDVLDEAGQALTAGPGGRGVEARFRHCDVSKEAEVARVIGEVAAHLGRLDVRVNNAGVSGSNQPTHEVTEAEWDRVQAIDVKGCSSAPGMRLRTCAAPVAAASSTCRRSTASSGRRTCRHTTRPRARRG
jgi:NAD(P)-dependent dehydrogenase (short-subunit alcohol dehydrogenase family)